ncbi:MAG: radical SAM protein [Nanoarchaeota archaeon]
MFECLNKLGELLEKEKPPNDYGHQLLRDHMYRIRGILAGKNPPPYELEIQTTGACNLNCSHCFGRYYKRIGHSMTLDELTLIASRVADFKEDGYQIDTIKFCGTTGEPLVNPVTLDGIRIFKCMDRKVILYTNGLLLGKMHDDLHYYDIVAKADKVNISLDADSEETFLKIKGRSGFNKIISNIEHLVNVRTDNHKIVTSYVVNKHNYTGILPFARNLRSIGVDEIWYRVDFTDLKSIKALSKEISTDLKKAVELSTEKCSIVSVYSEDDIKGEDDAFNSYGKKCYNQCFWACVGPNCELYACGHRTHGGVKSFGSLLDHSFKEVWNSKKRLKSLSKLPDKHCRFCSPSSRWRNIYMNFFSKL